MSSQECVKCHGAAQTYLCRLCTTELRQQLLRMPTLVGYLQDHALGLTRLSTEQSRSRGFESRTPTLNKGASDLVEEIERILGQWARPLAITHGFVISAPVTRNPVGYKHTSADYATFLAAHTAELAKDEYVGELCGSLRRFIRSVYGAQEFGGPEEGGLVQRRIPPPFWGPCPASIIDHSRCRHPPEGSCIYRAHECAAALNAPRGALEVTCGVCGAVHSSERLRRNLEAQVDKYKGTIPEIYDWLWDLGERVKIDTLYHWANPKRGNLRPAGYLRADGRRIAPTRHSDEDKPVYLVSDVRKMRAEKMKPGHRGPKLNKVKGSK